LLAEAAAFYRRQLDRAPEGLAYLAQRGIRDIRVLEALGVGYAPGACLRRHLLQLGYTESELRHAGLINAKGGDAFYRRVVFPLEQNLYGRSIGDAPPHRSLPGGKGGLCGYQRWCGAEAGDSGRRHVRPGRTVAGRLLELHLLLGCAPEPPAVPATRLGSAHRLDRF
jgi:hypothetical protein